MTTASTDFAGAVHTASTTVPASDYQLLTSTAPPQQQQQQPIGSSEEEPSSGDSNRSSSRAPGGSGQPGAGGGTGAAGAGAAGGSFNRFTTVGLGVVMIVGLVTLASTHYTATNSSMSSSSSSMQIGQSFPAARSLLSVDSSSSSSVSLSSSSPFGYEPVFCNLPYESHGATSIALRIFAWLGCVFACLALFPQFIYNDAYTKSVAGLSFFSVALGMISNLAFVGAAVLPRHNDWFSNRYAEGEDDADSEFFRNQVTLPLVIAAGFTFLQAWVLVVQRAKYKQSSRK